MKTSTYFGVEIKETGLSGMYEVIRNDTAPALKPYLTTETVMDIVNDPEPYGGVVVIGADGKDKISEPVHYDHSTASAQQAFDEDPEDEEGGYIASVPLSGDLGNMVNEIIGMLTEEEEKEEPPQKKQASSSDEFSTFIPLFSGHGNLSSDQIRRILEADTWEEIQAIVRENND